MRNLVRTPIKSKRIRGNEAIYHNSKNEFLKLAGFRKESKIKDYLKFPNFTERIRSLKKGGACKTENLQRGWAGYWYLFVVFDIGSMPLPPFPR